jgi:cytosine/uracil/thiamine/allantoin permease
VTVTSTTEVPERPELENPDPRLHNEDLAPARERNWKVFDLFAMWIGMETIRKFIDFCGPVVYVVMFALAIWILTQTGTSSLSLQLSPRAEGSAIGHMANAAMLIVAYFAALLLNFGDFSRFARDEKAMKVGNFLGLPSISSCSRSSR